MKLFFPFLLLLIVSCNLKKNEHVVKDKNQVNEAEDQADNYKLYAMNASQFGVNYPETFVLMENRRGIRIEYNLDRNNLQLWISPLAGKSLDYYDRNWSNRDDHTNIFDRILIQGLQLSDFDSCQYDPFHCVLFYKNQRLHISQIYDQPTVLVWLEQGGEIDFKVYGKEVKRDNRILAVNATDRERQFQFSAILGKGEGTIQHQPFLDKGRSIYARAHLAPDQIMMISGELESENILDQVLTYQNLSIAEILDRNKRLIDSDLKNGRFALSKNPPMQKVLDINRRVALSFQTFNGYMRTSNKFIYYLYWIRDANINTNYIANTGWTRPMKDNLVVSLNNPSIIPSEPYGKFYGQLLTGPITKWQEDGIFYVIWQAFAYWTQTGDDTFIKGKYLETMKEALRSVENYCYDPEKGLFGRYYTVETPLTNSRDDKFDMANGAPTYSSEVKYKNKTITRSYDLYNIYFYNCYRMLSSFCNDQESIDYYNNKASLLLDQILPLYTKHAQNGMPSFGYFLTSENELLVSDKTGLHSSSLGNALSIPWFQPFRPTQYFNIRNQLFDDAKNKSTGILIKSLMTLLLSLDNQLYSEAEAMEIINSLVPQSIRPGKYLPMPYTIPEHKDTEDGNPFHDIRPIVYSSAPWLATITSFGLRRFPYGFAVRPTKFLDSIYNFEYMNQLLHIRYDTTVTANKARLTMNGTELTHTWQIPVDSLIKGDNHLQVKSIPVEDKNLLIGSSVLLNGYQLNGKEIVYDIKAYGHNELQFKNKSGKLNISDLNGKNIPYQAEEVGNLEFIYFDGRGKFKVRIID